MKLNNNSTRWPYKAYETDCHPPRVSQHAEEHELEAPREDRWRCGGQDAEGGKGEDEGPRGPRHNRPVRAGHPQ